MYSKCKWFEQLRDRGLFCTQKVCVFMGFFHICDPKLAEPSETASLASVTDKSDPL